MLGNGIILEVIEGVRFQVREFLISGTAWHVVQAIRCCTECHRARREKACALVGGFSYDQGIHPACCIGAGADARRRRTSAASRRRAALTTGPAHRERHKETPMLWTIFVILLVRGCSDSSPPTRWEGFIHILLVIAVVVIIIQLLQGLSPTPLSE